MGVTSTEQSSEQKADVYSVEQLNRIIRQTIEGQLTTVWVKGEISNFKPHTSGHFYFSLKDPQSQIKAVMFRGFNSRLKFKPKDGMEVIVRGKVSVYEPRGDYQIICEMMEPVGAGALQKAFEELKNKLRLEGLFDAARKRPIPQFPRHVAIVTSPTGAAIRDMLNILSRRNRNVEITIVPTLVQGESAIPHIREALRRTFLMKNVDVIIIARGGGSIEDMWCFNDETIARMIASSPVPVISGIGHEIDFTIADFVADLRAPTPSAAAELVIKSSDELSQKVKAFEKLITLSIQKIIKNEVHRLKVFQARLIDPKRKLQDLVLRNDELFIRMQNAMERFLSKKRTDQELSNIKLKNAFKISFEKIKSRMKEALSMLDSLSPLKVIDRGYAIAHQKQKVVREIEKLKLGEDISVVVSGGTIEAKISQIKLKENPWISKKN